MAVLKSFSENNLCACKGIRSCLLCENRSKFPHVVVSEKLYTYCSKCNVAWKSSHKDHVSLHQDTIYIDGITIINDFISEAEEVYYVNEIEKFPWVDSQSGRRKQDFGPKVNFKKRKVKMASFMGFPSFTEPLFAKLKQLPLLPDFRAVELCHLEYFPDRGSAIDPHKDDSWLWGERLVTLNLLSATFLTLSPSTLPRDCQVRIHMPARSLLILRGEARHQWLHAVLREDIVSRRLAMTWRELSEDFAPGSQNEDVGKVLLKLAELFF